MFEGQVYFLENAGRIKIGTSTNLKKRMQDIGVHLVGELKLVAAIPGDFGVEQAIHRLLSAHRLRGEWFTDCDEVRELIESLQNRGLDAIAHVYHPKPRQVFEVKPLTEIEKNDRVLVALQRVIKVAQHPILVEIRSIGATAKELGVDPAPALAAALRKIPGPNKSECWNTARLAIAEASKKIDRISELQILDLFAADEGEDTFWSKVAGSSDLAEEIAAETERCVIAALGPIDRAGAAPAKGRRR